MAKGYRRRRLHNEGREPIGIFRVTTGLDRDVELCVAGNRPI